MIVERRRYIAKTNQKDHYMKRTNYGRSESQIRRNEIITMAGFIGLVVAILVIILYNLSISL